MKENIKIAVVTSTRADWGLLHPLVSELSRRQIKPLIIATYAHLFPEMGDTIDELVEDGFPPTMSVPARRDPREAVGDTLTGFSKAFRFLKPDVVVILGDRIEMLGVTTAALLERVPIAHIAGGTVSEGAVDDAIRNSISQMAELHFPETEKGRTRLVLAGINPQNVHTAGALGVYNTVAVPEMSKTELEKYLDFHLGDRYLLGTFHSATLSDLDAQTQMDIWLKALEILTEEVPNLKFLLTFPNTDSDANPLLNRMFTFRTAHPERVKIVSSLGRIRYINAARHASVVAGNSSSGIVEIPSLGVPVVDVGIRQQGRPRTKAVIHAPLEADAIVKAVKYSLTPEARDIARNTSNPYFKADTPQLIADRLIDFVKTR